LANLSGGKVGAILAELLREARKTAVDQKTNRNASRAAALRTLGLAPFGDVRELFCHGLAISATTTPCSKPQWKR